MVLLDIRQVILRGSSTPRRAESIAFYLPPFISRDVGLSAACPGEDDHLDVRPRRNYAGRGGAERVWSTPSCGRSKQPRRKARVSIIKKLAIMKKLMIAVCSMPDTGAPTSTRPIPTAAPG